MKEALFYIALVLGIVLCFLNPRTLKKNRTIRHQKEDLQIFKEGDARTAKTRVEHNAFIRRWRELLEIAAVIVGGIIVTLLLHSC